LSHANPRGSFATVTTQALAGVTWDLSEPNSNGRVTVVGPPAVDYTPTDITYSMTGDQLHLQSLGHRSGRKQKHTRLYQKSSQIKKRVFFGMDFIDISSWEPPAK